MGHNRLVGVSQTLAETDILQSFYLSWFGDSKRKAENANLSEDSFSFYEDFGTAKAF